MGKSADAFRTISEVADWLETPAHVLRFWESKFSQVKPVKRAGGRRYYRPADMRLLGGIKKLLHDDGMTIKGVQKLLRDQGVKHVSNMAPALDDGLQDATEASISLDAVDQTPSDGAQVLDFARGAAKSGAPETTAPDPETPDPDPQDQPREPELFGDTEPETADPETPPERKSPDDPTPTSDDSDDAEADLPETPVSAESPDSLAAQSDRSAQDDQPETPATPAFRHHSAEDALAPSEDSIEDAPEQPTGEPDAETPGDAQAPSAPKPNIIELADDAPDTVEAGLGVLSKLCGLSSPRDADTAKQLEQVAHRLRALIKD